jgi:transketolase
MRGAFVRTLTELAAVDRRIVLLTGDLGYMALEPFAERFPERFVNVGVAEQNMLGIATGLAEAGWIPFVYSIVTFATLRPYEFLRNGPVAHRLPVRVVGVGAGFEYGPQGRTHHGLEDVAVTRVQPGLTVIAPADHQQMATALRATWSLPGPIYYRIGKDDRTVIPGLSGRFRLGCVEHLRAGRDIVIVTSGAIASEALAAAEGLARGGIEAAVLLAASLQPPPVDALVAALTGVPLAATVEAHHVTGGLGSLVAEVIAEAGLGCRLVRCGVRGLPDGVSGSQRYLEDRHGISAGAIVEAIERALSARSG